MINIFHLYSLDISCFMQDTALPNNDVDSYPKVKDPVKCQKLCQDNVECYYWTMNKKGNCFLKNQNAILNVVAKPKFTSGLKNCGKGSVDVLWQFAKCKNRICKSKNYKCKILIVGCNGGDNCCTSSNQCNMGEGDCDSDNDCKENLVCGADNCAGSTFDSTDDCCTEPWK